MTGSKGRRETECGMIVDAGMFVVASGGQVFPVYSE
jgi:hypothetical protein